MSGGAPPERDVPPPVLRATGEHAALRGGTPSGLRAVRGPRGPGLRLFGLTFLDRAEHGGAAPSPAPDTHVVSFRDVAAIVEPAPYANEPVTPPELDRYRAVAEEVFARRPLVPAPPGTVFRSAEVLAGWLELHYFTLVEALNYVEDRVVARVTVQRGATEPPRAPTLKLAEHDATPEAELPDDDLVAQLAEPFRALRREAVSLIVLRPDEPGAGGGDVAHGSFLVDRARWAAFQQAVAHAAAQHSAYRFGVTGPWPAYDFVRLQFHGRAGAE